MGEERGSRIVQRCSEGGGHSLALLIGSSSALRPLEKGKSSPSSVLLTTPSATSFLSSTNRLSTSFSMACPTAWAVRFSLADKEGEMNGREMASKRWERVEEGVR